jgi:SAM-dependent methyltransferase
VEPIEVATDPISEQAEVVADPISEQAEALLLRLIQQRHPGPKSQKWMENDLNHLRRFVTSVQWVPDGVQRVLDPAAGGGAYFPELLRQLKGCDVVTPSYFNLEKKPAPFADATFDCVVLMEVLEHFTVDPMYAMAELNRVLKPGGFLFLTTPNIASWLAIAKVINHQSPYLYGLFERVPNPDRHNREYSVVEVGWLAEAAGFHVERLEGISVYPNNTVAPTPGISPENRGDSVFCLARKEGPVIDRYPSWLYANWGN